MQPPLIDALYEALNTDLGIRVKTSDAAKLRQKLYAERKKDETLKCISITISDDNLAVYLVKTKEPEDG